MMWLALQYRGMCCRNEVEARAGVFLLVMVVCVVEVVAREVVGSQGLPLVVHTLHRCQQGRHRCTGSLSSIPRLMVLHPG